VLQRFVTFYCVKLNNVNIRVAQNETQQTDGTAVFLINCLLVISKLNIDSSVYCVTLLFSTYNGTCLGLCGFVTSDQETALINNRLLKLLC